MVDAISRETVSQGRLALERLLKIRQPGIGLSLFFWTQDQRPFGLCQESFLAQFDL